MKSVFLTTAINTAFVPVPFFSRWTQMLARKLKGTECQDLDFDVYLQLGASIPEIARIHQIKGFIEESKCDWFLNIDADQDWDDDAISKMIELDKDIVSAPVVMKGGCFAPNIYEYNKEFNILENKLGHMPTMPFQVFNGGVGFGMIAIKREVLDIMWNTYKENILKVGKINNWGNKTIGEDLGFCYNAQQMGYEIWVEPSIKTNHYSYKGSSIKDHYEWYDNNFNNIRQELNNGKS